MFENVVLPDRSTIDNLMEIGRAYVKFSREHEKYFKILLHFEGNENFNLKHEAYAMMCEHGLDPMIFLIQLLRKGFEEGSIRSDIPPDILAHCLWSQTTGILRLTKYKDYHSDLKNHSEDDIINAHLEIIYHGILKKI